MTNENYCPCCASDNIEFVQSEHFDNGMAERMQCNYCGSVFENAYKYVKQNVIKDNSNAMYMARAKEVIETELKTLGDNINTSRGFADGKVHFILESLIGTLNELDSEDLAKLYVNSSYAQEYEMDRPTEPMSEHDKSVYRDELNNGADAVLTKIEALQKDMSLGMNAHYFLAKITEYLSQDMGKFIEDFKQSNFNR